MSVETTEKCPACGGTGEVKASIVTTYEIENYIKYLANEQNEKYVKLQVHPFIYAYLTKGFPSLRMKWIFKNRIWIVIKPYSAYNLLEYHFFNKKEDEYKL